MSEVESTMIERVARTIWDINRPDGAPDFDELDFLDQGRVKQIARACIKEMRMPTEEMKREGWKEIDTEDSSKNDAEIVWENMIQAALKED